jgi:putative ABC transport system permease protein
MQLFAGLWQDFRLAARMLAKSPGFTAIVVIALGLGLGINAYVSSAVDSLMLRPISARDPSQLVTVVIGPSDQPRVWGQLSHPEYLEVQRQDRIFSGVVAVNGDDFTFGTEEVAQARGAEHPETISGQFVSGNYFDVLGVPAFLGRTFSPEEGSSPAAEPAIVISHALWRRRFNRDPAVLGRKVFLTGDAMTVIGVMPRSFKDSPDGRDYWIPFSQHQRLYGPDENIINSRTRRVVTVMGRLMPGVSRSQAQAQLSVLAQTMAQQFPATNAATKIDVISEVEGRFGADYAGIRLGAYLALLVAGLVLLISCANVTNLLLARAAKRGKEQGVRLALGAGRMRIVRQLMVESLLLALMGGVLGLLITLWFGDLLQALLPAMPLAQDLELHPDLSTLLWILAASCLAGVVSGVLPAVRASRTDLLSALKSDIGAEGQGLRRAGIRQLLVVAQLAISLVVVASAGLLFRSLANMETIEIGLQPDNLVSGLINPVFSGDEVGVKRFFTELVNRLEQMPGVVSVSGTRYMPLVNQQGECGPIVKEGDPPPPPNQELPTPYSVVLGHYFETVGTPLLFGRDFHPRELEGIPTTVIINRRLAERLFGDPAIAVGKRLRVGPPEAPLLQVVGVAADGRYRELLEAPTSYLLFPGNLPYLRDSNWTMNSILIRARSPRDMASIATGLRKEVEALDARLAIDLAMVGRGHLAVSLNAARLAAKLGMILGMLALLLATMGIYGVMTYSVSQRTKEIGIRIALGGQTGDVLRLVIGQGMALIGIGVIIGGVGALALCRLLRRFLFGVGTADPLTLVLSAVLLSSVALLATLIPVRRATKVDPMVALRYE